MSIEKNMATAQAYYQAMSKKDVTSIAQYLSSDIHFISPLTEVNGKDAMLNAIKGFMTVLTSLSIRACCGTNNHVMLAYDFSCPQPLGTSRAAALFTFKDDLITHLELFFDARPFEKN